jgi:hypothetical protein
MPDLRDMHGGADDVNAEAGKGNVLLQTLITEVQLLGTKVAALASD